MYASGSHAVGRRFDFIGIIATVPKRWESLTHRFLSDTSGPWLQHSKPVYVRRALSSTGYHQHCDAYSGYLRRQQFLLPARQPSRPLQAVHHCHSGCKPRRLPADADDGYGDPAIFWAGGVGSGCFRFQEPMVLTSVKLGFYTGANSYDVAFRRHQFQTLRTWW